MFLFHKSYGRLTIIDQWKTRTGTTGEFVAARNGEHVTLKVSEVSVQFAS